MYFSAGLRHQQIAIQAKTIQRELVKLLRIQHQTHVQVTELLEEITKLAEHSTRQSSNCRCIADNTLSIGLHQTTCQAPGWWS